MNDLLAYYPFSQQECQDWIVLELARNEETPRMLGYARGIAEITRRVKERYGNQHVATAMDIVYGLIEDGRNASGLGDDGDWWACW